VRLAWGVVTGVEREAQGIQHLSVALDDGVAGRAIAYPALSGHCEPGDRVLLNTTAVDLSLGTGGSHFVVARAEDGSRPALDAPGPGHIMKLRYTPLQIDTGAVEEQGSPHHADMAEAEDLGGMPAVCCSLHSHVPLVAAAAKACRPGARIAYCMTDAAALPLPLSDVVRDSREAGLLDTTVTCGQAFGGEIEAVNVHSGLLAARHVARADIAIVAIGPGVVGTATRFGHGGVAQGEAVNAVAALGGAPVFSLRISFADERPRHRAVSHHSLVALSRVTLAPAHVAVPHLPADQAVSVEAALADAGVWERHIRVEPMPATGEPDMRGVRVTTMGRSIAEDPSFFEAAFAAGRVAANLMADAAQTGA